MKKLLALTAAFTIYFLTASAQNTDFVEGLRSFDVKVYDKSFALLMPYAEQGNCMAQFVIGFQYQNGLGAPADLVQARYWLERAADQKQAMAMGPLAANFFANDALHHRDNLIHAYLWSVLASEYEPSQKGTSTRFVIRAYLKKEELEAAEKLIREYEARWSNQENCN